MRVLHQILPEGCAEQGQPRQQEGLLPAGGGRCGHGDYSLVLAPYSVQELCELMQESFSLAEKYRNLVILLSGATLAKMRESVELPSYVTDEPAPAGKPNALRGCGKKEPHKGGNLRRRRRAGDFQRLAPGQVPGDPGKQGH